MALLNRLLNSRFYDSSSRTSRGSVLSLTCFKLLSGKLGSNSSLSLRLIGLAYGYCGFPLSSILLLSRFGGGSTSIKSLLSPYLLLNLL